MRIVQVDNTKDLGRLMKEIGVDPYGIKIMAPKATTHLIKLKKLSCVCANIIKQELLSLGADAAISRDAITAKSKFTDCLLIANSSQYKNLTKKLSIQPFGLSQLSQQISAALKDYSKEEFVLDLAKHKLKLSPLSTKIMAIVNVTSDSFSGDGILNKNLRKDQIIDLVKNLIADGADIIDVGGESSRPNAKPISKSEEIKRVIPIIKLITKNFNIPVSIDTYKPEVAKAALDNGASIVNSIAGLRDIALAKIIARYKACVVIMHMRGNPQNMQKNISYVNLIDDIIKYLSDSTEKALSFGIKKEKIIIDPGIGFGKTLEHNLDILSNLKDFKTLGMPILIGTSRKSFIGEILGNKTFDRLYGTLASCVRASQNGAHILRAHDVKAVKEAIKISNKIS